MTKTIVCLTWWLLCRRVLSVKRWFTRCCCRTQLSPNFLQIYDIFLAHEPPRPDLWGSRSHRKPTELLPEINSNLGAVICQENPSVSSNGESKRLFQYIRMEFCDGGNLEDFIGLMKDKTLSMASVAVPFLFQMAYSLYCAREKFNLRHCDIKVCDPCFL